MLYYVSVTQQKHVEKECGVRKEACREDSFAERILPCGCFAFRFGVARVKSVACDGSPVTAQESVGSEKSAALCGKLGWYRGMESRP